MRSIILGLILPISVFAEYRVYQFYVKSPHKFIQDDRAYLVTSTLDPKSYRDYHGGAQELKISLVRTWICPGHTGGMKEYCLSPYELLKKEEALEVKR